MEAPVEKTIKWWGYIHVDGDIQAKVYFTKQDTQEAIASPFCGRVFEPFEATDRSDAIRQIKNIIKNEISKM